MRDDDATARYGSCLRSSADSTSRERMTMGSGLSLHGTRKDGWWIGRSQMHRIIFSHKKSYLHKMYNIYKIWNILDFNNCYLKLNFQAPVLLRKGCILSNILVLSFQPLAVNTRPSAVAYSAQLVLRRCQQRPLNHFSLTVMQLMFSWVVRLK